MYLASVPSFIHHPICDRRVVTDTQLMKYERPTIGNAIVTAVRNRGTCPVVYFVNMQMLLVLWPICWVVKKNVN